MPGLKLAVTMLLLLTAVVGGSLMLTHAGVPRALQAARALEVGREMATAGARAGSLVFETLRSGQTRAPAVVVGLGALVIVPFMALSMLLARRLGTARAARQTSALRASRAADVAMLPRLANVWIDVDGPGQRRLRVAGEMVRIGRDEESDLRLDDPNVHRHHAIIQRTSDAEFMVVDVSGVRGNGMAVNGRRLARAWLKDGDLIELGTSRVRFRCEPISYALPA